MKLQRAWMLLLGAALTGCADKRDVTERTAHELLTNDSGGESQPDHSSEGGSDMNKLFFKFLDSPDRESYLAVRNALVSSDHYDPYSNEMDGINKLVDAGKLEEAREKLSESMPNLLLSPTAHATISFIAHELNDEKGAQMEEFIATTCCEGILASGDGTKDNPYIVVRISDEHDVVRYLGRQFSGQSLIDDGNRYFDLVNCRDGSEMWFDITDACNKHKERNRSRVSEPF